ncbi:MAG: HAD family hydrolase [Oscillospiraceae bacterium]|nr:HAD family hydrolase [Oscillospiraceae bacterium]
MIKMLVFDLDDTLLRSDKTVSEYTVSVLKKCRSLGIKVIYATGRGCTLDIVPQEVFDGYVRNGGAAAFAGNVQVYEKLISTEKARDLLIACDNAGIKIAAQDENRHYSNFNVDEIWSWIKYYTIVDFNALDINAEKMYALPETQQDVDIIKSNLPDWINLIIARDELAMFMHREANKSSAVSALAEYWGIENFEIMAFGDDLNDIDLLEFCGIGVAMGSALDEVKAVADYICDTNENDGAAKWVEEHVLRM